MNKGIITCADVASRIEEAMDGILAADESEGVRAHAASCEPCRLQLEQASRIVDTLGRNVFVADEASMAAVTRALGEIDRLSRTKPRNRRRTWLLGSAWAVALLVAMRALAGAGENLVLRAATFIENGDLGGTLALAGIPATYPVLAGVAILLVMTVRAVRVH